MHNDENERIFAEFFNLETWGGLADFVVKLNSDDTLQRALKYYCETWKPQEGETLFDPATRLSKDLSAIYYGNCPVIFEGSNQWSQKCYFDRAHYDAKLNVLFNRCARLREANPKANICLVLVPEKDFLISAVLLKEDRFSAMTAAVASLRERLRPFGIELIFEDAVDRMDEYQTVADFEYPDSHLAPRNYVVIFSRALDALGLNWAEVAPRVDMQKVDVYFDLSTKFVGLQNRAVNLYDLNFNGEAIRQVGGSASFEDPLSNTSQSFENDQAVYDHSVLILGDSHSSILAQRRLTYLFAGTFGKTHFDWNPTGINPDKNSTGYDNLVLEISSRFVF